MFKPITIKEKPLYSFSNLLALVVVVSGFIYLFIGDRRELVTGVVALITTAMLVSVFMVIICGKDEEIRQLHLEAKNLALKTSGTFIDNASLPKETKVEVINTENISGNIVADKLVVPTDEEIKPKTKLKK